MLEIFILAIGYKRNIPFLFLHRGSEYKETLLSKGNV